ncbi:6319_t:CDS:2, partial [Cetraspora pellucida]
QLASLNKFFQKRNLYFHDIVPMIDATITNIQKDYIMDTNLSYHLQMFIDHTNPFNENQSEVTYYTHILAYNSCDYDDLLQDVYEYANIVTTKIKDRFPDRLLLAAMKISNPVEWSCKKEELLEFGYTELQTLLNHFGISKTINGQKFLPLIDMDSCIIEWSGFKNVIFSNFLTFSSQELLPLLIRDYSDLCPNIIKLVHISNSIPFSSVDCEQGKESKEMNWDKIFYEWNNIKN